jgi:hypothetical protein
MFIAKQKYLKIRKLYFNRKDDICHSALYTRSFSFLAFAIKNFPTHDIL